MPKELIYTVLLVCLVVAIGMLVAGEHSAAGYLLIAVATFALDYWKDKDEPN